MNYLINIQNDDNHPINPEKLEIAAITTLNLQSVESNSEMTIIITDNKSVTELNKTYRGIEAPTDVLSFPADIPLIGDLPPYLGDLIVAYPYAEKQAKLANIELVESFMLLIIHGTLHLLGYDHDTEHNRRKMWAIQEKVLRHLHISSKIVPTLENQ